jgi:type III secretory pathway lipoprotein EscJ
MEKDWEKVYTSMNIQETYLLISMLEENNIKVVELNHQDSSYPVFGERKLYVHSDDVTKALEIIKTLNIE